MSNEWDAYASGWDQNPDVRTYSEKAYTSLTEMMDINGLRVLDFGCGTGLLSEKMAPFAQEIIALDPSEKMIAVLAKKKLPHIFPVSETLTSQLIKTHPHFDKKFDLIVASSVCGFLTDFSKTLTLIKSLLVSGGYLFNGIGCQRSKKMG